MDRGWPFGPRLPAGPPSPPEHPCFVDPNHGPAMRFELRRYGRVVGTVLLCGNCYNAANPRGPVDPLHVEDAA